MQTKHDNLNVTVFTLLLTALILFAPSLYAQDGTTVVVKGEGVIYKNDRATAKEKAIDQALRLSVEQVVGSHIKSSTLVKNFVTVNDKILSQSKGYVTGWEELSTQVEGGVVIVELKITVKNAKLKSDLDAIEWALMKRNYPRMMLMIAEQNIGQTGYSYWWGTTAGSVSLGQVENTLIDELSKLGFTLIDPQVLSGKIKMKKAYEVTTGAVSDEAANEIAHLTDAQIVIVGKAIATDAGPVSEGSKLRSGQADVTVRAINTDNGEVIMTASLNAAEPHISATTAGNKAFIKAGKALAKEIVDKLVDKWLASSATVTLQISGLTDYAMLDAFKTALTHQVSGVTGVMERKMMKDKAQVDLYFEGQTSLLAKELNQKSFDGFSVKVEAVTANQLTLNLSKK